MKSFVLIFCLLFVSRAQAVNLSDFWIQIASELSLYEDASFSEILKNAGPKEPYQVQQVRTHFKEYVEARIEQGDLNSAERGVLRFLEFNELSPDSSEGANIDHAYILLIHWFLSGDTDSLQGAERKFLQVERGLVSKSNNVPLDSIGPISTYLSVPASVWISAYAKFAMWAKEMSWPREKQIQYIRDGASAYYRSVEVIPLTTLGLAVAYLELLDQLESVSGGDATSEMIDEYVALVNGFGEKMKERKARKIFTNLVALERFDEAAEWLNVVGRERTKFGFENAKALKLSKVQETCDLGINAPGYRSNETFVRFEKSRPVEFESYLKNICYFYKRAIYGEVLPAEIDRVWK